MKSTKLKEVRRNRRKLSVRAKLRRTASLPRLSVHRSLKHISAQIVDDASGRTLCAATSTAKALSGDLSGKTKTEQAALIGGEIARRAKGASIENVVFDRGAASYHGRVKALAEAGPRGRPEVLGIHSEQHMNTDIRYLDAAEVDQLSTLSEVLVKINRCAVVVKGGRRFSFSALSISGNRDGVVGVGFGKGRQVPTAIEKAARDARKHLLRVPITGAGSVPHEVEATYCGARIRLVPASEGTGIIAGASVRAVCEMSGIRNILTKSYGSNNPINLVKATLTALTMLRTRDEVASLRGVELEQVGQ